MALPWHHTLIDAQILPWGHCTLEFISQIIHDWLYLPQLAFFFGGIVSEMQISQNGKIPVSCKKFSENWRCNQPVCWPIIFHTILLVQPHEHSSSEKHVQFFNGRTSLDEHYFQDVVERFLLEFSVLSWGCAHKSVVVFTKICKNWKAPIALLTCQSPGRSIIKIKGEMNGSILRGYEAEEWRTEGTPSADELLRAFVITHQ